jgi:hypothetical protein
VETESIESIESTLDVRSLHNSKVRIKSYGSALVKARWNFSDETLWNRVRPLICSEGRRYADRWLD